MRKQVFGRKLQRDANERKALFKGLLESLVLKESIKTTEAKAKAVKGQAEKLVTKAKLGGEKAERLLRPFFNPVTMKKLIVNIAPRFQNRPGGYTRIIKLGNRFADNAEMVILEWVDKGNTAENVKEEKKNSSKSEKVEAETKVEKPKKKVTTKKK